MTYKEATEILFNRLPMFQSIGPGAYKPGLETTLRLSAAFGNPHERLRAIHIAGTNGKGSTASMMAAVLASAGHRTALYTSPHLRDFRERMRIDGEMITRQEVCDFVERWQAMDLGDLQPTFFELTTVMAFEWFVRRGVDVAVVEAGLGGRLDSTNILPHPLLCIITNISLDHTALLGDTAEAIAREKAGIMKRGVPVVVGEAPQPGVRETFARCAAQAGAPLCFAEESASVVRIATDDEGNALYDSPFGRLISPLSGDYQTANVRTLCAALQCLGTVAGASSFTEADVARGIADTPRLSGLAGRWQRLGGSPEVICDTGHNAGGWQWLGRQLRALAPRRLHLVIGFVNDKDISAILRLMPPDAEYYFTRASVARALPAESLAAEAARHGLRGEVYPDVAAALAAARSKGAPQDVIFVGGSTFIVADLLTHLHSAETIS